jgi:hypothetical protein
MPADATREVWKVERYYAVAEDDEGRQTNLNHRRVSLCVERPIAEEGNMRIDEFLYGSDDGDDETGSRAAMAARAPTFYRLLEQIVQLGCAPKDLDEVIRINLYRAAPSVYPSPEIHIPPRRNAWQKLLDDDVSLEREESDG